MIDSTNSGTTYRINMDMGKTTTQKLLTLVSHSSIAGKCLRHHNCALHALLPLRNLKKMQLSFLHRMRQNPAACNVLHHPRLYPLMTHLLAVPRLLQANLLSRNLPMFDARPVGPSAMSLLSARSPSLLHKFMP